MPGVIRLERKGAKMVKLVFPKGDPRAIAGLISKRRPWLRQGAVGQVVVGGKKLGMMRQYTTPVQFAGAPAGNYDLVSPEFLSRRNVVSRKARDG